MRDWRYFFAPLVGCFLWAGRVLGSIGMWMAGAFTWIVIGAVWFGVIAWTWTRETAKTEAGRAVWFLIGCGMAAGLGVALLPVVYGMGEYIGYLMGRC